MWKVLRVLCLIKGALQVPKRFFNITLLITLATMLNVVCSGAKIPRGTRACEFSGSAACANGMRHLTRLTKRWSKR